MWRTSCTLGCGDVLRSGWGRVLAVIISLAITSSVLMSPGQFVTPALADEAKPQAQVTGQAPAPQQTAPESVPPAPVAGSPPQPTALPGGALSFRLENADLLQFINLVATQLHMNYIVDPAVKGSVSIATTGALRQEDLFPVLQSVLKINGAVAIQVGNFYRIVPLGQAPKAPIEPSDQIKGEIPSDDRMILRIIPLRFVLAADMAKIITPFLSESGMMAVHEGGNILILLDTSLKMKQLMDIMEQFDSTTYARQRIQLLPVQNNVASGMVPELESIFSAYAMNDKRTPVQFVPLDRINSILAVAPEPSTLDEVKKWIETLDQSAPPSGVQTFIYKVQNSEARYLAQLVRGFAQNAPSGEMAEGLGGGEPMPMSPAGGGSAMGAGAARGAKTLAAAEVESTPQSTQGGVRIVVDQVNNYLLIQCTAQKYAEIVKTLQQLDVIPRQVMIEARVYEVDLTGALSVGLTYYLQQNTNTYEQPTGSFSSSLQASVGTMVGTTRQLLAYLNASENKGRVTVLSAPTVLATDNSEAKIEVGSEVPYLTSEGVIPGVQSGSTSVFTNTIQNMDTGIILTVTPRITSTGLVSLKVDQEVSSAQPAAAGAAIQSPSFLRRKVTTQAVVGDGQTISLGGLISRNYNYNKNRIPLLGDIPGLGALFGSTTYSTTETELIVFLTPHIIKSVEEAHDATRELQQKLQNLRNGFKRDKLLNP